MYAVTSARHNTNTRPYGAGSELRRAGCLSLRLTVYRLYWYKGERTEHPFVFDGTMTETKRPKGKRPAADVSRNMAAIRSTDTKVERTVRSALWRRGFRFRKNDRRFPGSPDVVFPTEQVAVFCDSDFWHGRDWEKLQQRLTTNPTYWVAKIERNRQRDEKVTSELEAMGWKVIRLWESDIYRDLAAAIELIADVVIERRQQRG